VLIVRRVCARKRQSEEVLEGASCAGFVCLCSHTVRVRCVSESLVAQIVQTKLPPLNQLCVLYLLDFLRKIGEASEVRAIVCTPLAGTFEPCPSVCDDV
jgi:hypothetical protein